LGGNVSQLRASLQQGGLLNITGGVVRIDGDCSTPNSRMYWQDPQTRCTDDATAYKAFLNVYNTEDINLAALPGQPEYRLDKVPADPSVPKAQPWPRFGVISKTYFTVKSRPISNSTLKRLIDSSAQLSDEASFWGEWTAFGVASNVTTTSAFPWLKEAQALMRIEMASPSNITQFNEYRSWLLNTDKYWRTAVG
jgi:hypothetical protein